MNFEFKTELNFIKATNHFTDWGELRELAETYYKTKDPNDQVYDGPDNGLKAALLIQNMDLDVRYNLVDFINVIPALNQMINLGYPIALVPNCHYKGNFYNCGTYNCGLVDAEDTDKVDIFNRGSSKRENWVIYSAFLSPTTYTPELKSFRSVLVRGFDLPQ